MLAQVSVEFVTFLAILLAVFFFTFVYGTSTYLKVNSEKILLEAQSLSDQIASEINLALKAGDGYSRVFFLPNKLSNSIDYTVKVENYLVIVEWHENSVQSSTITEGIEGDLAKGINTIKNEGGIIYVFQ